MGSLKIGSVMGDVKLFRGPVGDAYNRVASVLRTLDPGDANVELVFDFPGDLSQPDYQGVKVRRREGNPTQAWIAVPSEIRTLKEPEAILLALAAAGLRAALQREARGGGGEPSGLPDLIAAAAAELGITHGLPAVAVPGPREEIDRTASVIEARWSLTASESNDERMGRLLVFQEKLDSKLHSLGRGFVDGNEIGDGTYSVFVETTAGDRPTVIKAILDLAARTLGELPEIVTSQG